MQRIGLAIVLGGGLLAACDHSMPPSGVSDRWAGPWQAGTPAQLTAFPVNVLGLSADGRQVLFTRRDRTPITGPNGERAPQDTLDICLGVLPATGGSGTFMDCDRRLGQQDSLNAVLAAALDAEGRLLQAISVGPIDDVSPVREHVNLYLGSTQDLAVHRPLMTLYRDRDGTPTVPAGSLNWITDLTWFGPDRFAALGHFTPPALYLDLTYVGIVIGQVGPDSATTTLLTNWPRPVQIGPGPDASLILVYGDGRVVALTSAGDQRWVVQVPLEPGGRFLGIGCHSRGCIAATEGAIPGRISRWQIGSGGGDPIAGQISQTSGPVGRAWVSAQDGALIFTAGGGLFRLD